MSKYIHPATTEAALRVASNLLPDDYREVKDGHGHDPLNALVVGVHNSESVYFTNPDDEICGLQESTQVDKSGCYVPQLF